MDADGANKTRLTFTPGVQETWPSWSPDGLRIAFTSDVSGSQDIWVMDADGGNQTRLTINAAFDAYPEWSPDGTKIAFTSNRAANDDIWVMDADGSNPTRLTAGQQVDERPGLVTERREDHVLAQRQHLEDGREREQRGPADVRART